MFVLINASPYMFRPDVDHPQGFMYPRQSHQNVVGCCPDFTPSMWLYFYLRCCPAVCPAAAAAGHTAGQQRK
jgi:hypothetical protein